jgi:hypothetical protein
VVALFPKLLNEVLNLPFHKRKELAELLRKTTLSSIITASKIVADRLNLSGLEVWTKFLRSI